MKGLPKNPKVMLKNPKIKIKKERDDTNFSIKKRSSSRGGPW